MKTKAFNLYFLLLASVLLCASVMGAFSQTETPPPPSAPKTVSVPPVQERKLPNGLTVVVVERHSSPIVTAQLLVKAGASAEDANKAGLANFTADLLTKGTKTRSATQIADDMAFLGSELNTGAGWNSSTVSFTATPNNLPGALAVIADVVMNPTFKQDELDLLKSQTLDELKYNLKQPSFIANYVASKYTFLEHPAGGIPESLASINVTDAVDFHDKYFRPENSILIFAGDLSLQTGTSMAEKYFGTWKTETPIHFVSKPTKYNAGSSFVRRLLVIDLPNSGQAAVVYARPISDVGRGDEQYHSASVLNSVLGGGYSSRLNYEIRIKRGLSYGAGSGISWRDSGSNFSTRVQTKNVSAAEVAQLTLGEIKRLSAESVANDELAPRKSTLTGNFGRNLETTAGLANAIGDLYSFGIPASELNNYMTSVNAVTDAQIRDFASKNLSGGDFIIVGDYSVFKDDLAKRFPDVKIDVIKADDLDLSKPNLRK